MSLWVDVKYANLLSAYTRNFKRKSDYLWNFSCVFCGDSSQNKTKARGYIYRQKTGLAYKCHNCSASTNIGNVIKHVDPNLYREYVMENYKESGAPRSQHKDVETAIPDILSPKEISDSILDPLKRIDKLSPAHPAVKYVLNRKIPARFWSLLYVAPKFKKFVNSIEQKFSDLSTDHPRLIIPYFNSHGKCFAFQGRAFGDEQPKYMTIKIDSDAERIYGLDRVNYSKRIYAMEGPIDSLFIPNAIAVSGSSFGSLLLKSLKANITVVPDNERRSPEIVKIIKKTIDEGYSVCLWPESFTSKDINDAVKAGMTPEEILDIINDNTYTGTEAQLHFVQWKKC